MPKRKFRMKRLARYVPRVALGLILGLFLMACGGTAPTFNDEAPLITSASSVTFYVGVAGSFTVTTIGTPTPTITESGSIPVAFVDNNNGTATITGTPLVSDVYNIIITASNGVGTPASQNFTLTVSPPAPPITNGNTLATASSHWVVANQCENSGNPTPGLQFELTSSDSGFKGSFTDANGTVHVSTGTWVVNSLTSVSITTTSVSNPGSYSNSWTVSSLDDIAGSTSSSQVTATVNWYNGDSSKMQTSVGCSFTLAGGGL
jgi:hypothetical protein